MSTLPKGCIIWSNVNGDISGKIGALVGVVEVGSVVEFEWVLEDDSSENVGVQERKSVSVSEFV